MPFPSATSTSHTSSPGTSPVSRVPPTTGCSSCLPPTRANAAACCGRWYAPAKARRRSVRGGARSRSSTCSHIPGPRTRYDPAFVSRQLMSDGPLGQFADRLLAIELPDLPPSARDETVAFVCRRANQMPSPLRLGLVLVCTGVGLAQRAAGLDRTARFLQRSRLPLLGELPRTVRSLGFAYIWETWPDTSPSGRLGPAPRGSAA